MPGPPSISAKALRYVAPAISPAQAPTIARGLGLAMKRYGITKPLRAAMFVAQCAHEADGFKTSEEYASGRDYEGRSNLGNVKPGDGVRYKGRGRIMITGRANYLRTSQALGQNFIAQPARLALPPWSELASAWWWANHGLNAICDEYTRTEDRLVACTRRINGGTNGLDSRRAYLTRAMRVRQALVPR